MESTMMKKNMMTVIIGVKGDCTVCADDEDEEADEKFAFKESTLVSLLLHTRPRHNVTYITTLTGQAEVTNSL